MRIGSINLLVFCTPINVSILYLSIFSIFEPFWNILIQNPLFVELRMELRTELRTELRALATVVAAFCMCKGC